MEWIERDRICSIESLAGGRRQKGIYVRAHFGPEYDAGQQIPNAEDLMDS